MLKARAIIAVLLGIACAVLVLRTAFVDAYAGANPSRAASIWPEHPKVLVSQALTEIGLAAVQRQPPPDGALQMIRRASRKSPLLHDPFLIRGINAQQAGDTRLAEQAFLAARRRAPREEAPRYFLSQFYLTNGRAREGLDELATLARLLPHGPVSVAPALASYVRSSGDVPTLKATFRNNPELERAVLVELSKDPANADTAFRLATRLHEADGSAADWVKVMLPRILESGRAEKAYSLWQRVAGVKAKGTLFDPAFSGNRAPPPFNWTYRSDSAGFAEPDGKGGLHVLFYGRDETVLASQAILLAPGDYALSMLVAGNPGGSLHWSVVCLRGNGELLELGLGDRATASPAGRFRVPQACEAQRIDLRGTARDLPKQVDVTIANLKLVRI